MNDLNISEIHYRQWGFIKHLTEAGYVYEDGYSVTFLHDKEYITVQKLKDKGELMAVAIRTDSRWSDIIIVENWYSEFVRLKVLRDDKIAINLAKWLSNKKTDIITCE